MLSRQLLICVVLVAVWQIVQPASVPFLTRLGEDITRLETQEDKAPGTWTKVEVSRARVREGVPPPLCTRRCKARRAGPVCAFDATGTARTFSSLCELEAASCRESTYYAITSLGEC